MIKKRLRAKLPLPLHPLADLAQNYWWTWTPDRLSIFRNIDPQLWRQCHHNPVKLLDLVSDERLDQLAADPTYLRQVQTLATQFQYYMHQINTWASWVAPQISSQQPVAYLCIEFGVHQSLRTYASGLGILAADHLKTASDLGLPMVGVGLLYRQGHFQQRLDCHGWQKHYYEDNQFQELPLELLCDQHGEPLTIELGIRHHDVKVQIWRVQVGRVNLYLLDTNREDNDPVDRGLTGQLYSGNQETRLAQEIILGIGGVRALQLLGLEPQVYHLNESHAAFALLEVARLEMERTDQSFYEVEPLVHKRCIFTTHTPVPAGHDAFAPDLIDFYFDHYCLILGLLREQFLALGARRLEDPWEPFNMAVLALRLCRTANGVSQRHGEVCRQMWSILYPKHPKNQVPIGQITNGVHARTWTAPLMGDLYAKYLDKDWSAHVVDSQIWASVDEIPNSEIWWRHQILKKRLIAHTRSQIQNVEQTLQAKNSVETLHATSLHDGASLLLDPQVLTIGFAHRFCLYKRGDLIIKDPQRALRIFSNPERPVQLIFAGKPHPMDEQGKRMIQRLIEWSSHPDLEHRVAFIENYDIYTAQNLIQGVDVWLNTSRRPLEAAGTSGQKVCFNGGIHCGVLDGWWCEGYQVGSDGKGFNGWAIGEHLQTNNQKLQDEVDAESLYHLLEEEIVPLYYDRDQENLPCRWIQMIKNSIKTVAPVFNTDRMLAEYITQMYLPELPEGHVAPIFASVPSNLYAVAD